MDPTKDEVTDDVCFCDVLRAVVDAKNALTRDHGPFCAAVEPSVSYHCLCCGTSQLLIEFQEVPDTTNKINNLLNISYDDLELKS